MTEADPRETFNVHSAKTNLSKLMERAHAGEEIVLAKAGKPYATLVRYQAPAKLKRMPGGLTITGEIPDSVWFDPMAEEDLASWDGKRLEKYDL